MKKCRSIMFGAAACAAALPGPASAAPIAIAKVDAHQVACAFDQSCQPYVVPVTMDFQFLDDWGDGRFWTHTFTGAPGTPADGKQEYDYRVDLSEMDVAKSHHNCVTAITLAFGPMETLGYGSGSPAQMFVETVGGKGSIAPVSVTSIKGPEGDSVIVRFAKPICPGESSYVFGFTSARQWVDGSIYASLTGKSFQPNHQMRWHGMIPRPAQ